MNQGCWVTWIKYRWFVAQKKKRAVPHITKDKIGVVMPCKIAI